MGHASAAKECVSYCVLLRLYGADPPLSEWYSNCGGYELYLHNGFTHELWCLSRAWVARECWTGGAVQIMSGIGADAVETYLCTTLVWVKGFALVVLSQ